MHAGAATVYDPKQREANRQAYAEEEARLRRTHAEQTVPQGGKLVSAKPSVTQSENALDRIAESVVASIDAWKLSETEVADVLYKVARLHAERV